MDRGLDQTTPIRLRAMRGIEIGTERSAAQAVLPDAGAGNLSGSGRLWRVEKCLSHVGSAEQVTLGSAEQVIRRLRRQASGPFELIVAGASAQARDVLRYPHQKQSWDCHASAT